MASRVDGVRAVVVARWRMLVRAARLAVGIPDYGAYREHLARAHPDRPPMTRDAFFRDRVDARYGRGRTRCC